MQLRYFANNVELFNIAITASSSPRIGEQIILVDEQGVPLPGGDWTVQSVKRLYPVLAIPQSVEQPGQALYELTSMGSHEMHIGLYRPGEASGFRVFTGYGKDKNPPGTGREY